MENDMKNTHTTQNVNQLSLCETIKIKDEIIDTEYNDNENYGSPQKCTECDKKLYQTSLETFVANDQNWKCKHCSIDYYNYTSNQSKGILVENYLHIKLENDKTYKCNFCNVSFTRQRYLIAHERIHSEDKVYNCNICSKQFTQHSNLIRHEKFHNIKKIYECKLCEKSFTRERYLNVHERVHSEEKIYECNQCNEIFLQHSNLLLHKRKHVNVQANSQVIIKTEPLSTPQTVNTLPYKCKICGKTFSTNYRLIGHRMLHRQNRPFRRKCRTCNKIFYSADNFSNHRRNKCCLCGQTFSSRFLLVEHQKTCVNLTVQSTDPKCDICHKIFATKTILKVHKKSHVYDKLVPIVSNQSTTFKRPKIDSYELKIHTKEISYVNNSFSIDENIIGTPFKCSKCNITFDYEICLVKHESIHNGAYRCNICDEIFLIQHHLLLHKKLHSNKSPCICDTCKQEFYHERHFILHTKSHQSELLNLNCIYCGKKSQKFNDLVQHEKMHMTDETSKRDENTSHTIVGNRNKCTKCNRSSSNLHKCNKTRNKIRSGKFKCETCERTFKYRSNLQVHVRIHTGEKPYVCSSCNKSFTQLNHFNSHVKREHRKSTPYIYVESKKSKMKGDNGQKK